MVIKINITNYTLKKERYSYGFWNSEENQRKFLNELYLKFNLKTHTDWLKISSNLITRHNGKPIISKYGCLFSALIHLYPEHQWKFFTIIKKLPKSFWNSNQNQKYFLNQLYNKLELSSFNDWNNVTNQQVLSNGGKELLDRYNGELKEAIKNIYIEEEIKNYIPPFSFKNIPKSYWNSRENQREYIHKLLKYYKMNELKEIFELKNSEIRRLGGREILLQYQNSLVHLMVKLFPEYDWSFLFKKKKKGKLPKEFWRSVDNQRLFCDYLFTQLNCKEMEEWYSISVKTIRKKGGARLLSKYNSNMYRLLTTVYPFIEWNFLKTNAKKGKFWSNIERQKQILIYFQHLFFIRSERDWFRISFVQLRKTKISSSIFSENGILQILRKIHPNISWNESKFHTKNKKSVQRWLFSCLHLNSPHLTLIEDYHHPLLHFKSNSLAELDLFFPSLNIAFEYQGEQHYDDLISGGFSPHENYLSRDIEKVNLCSQYLKLVIIPYWWNQSLSSLPSLYSLFKSSK